MDKPRTGVSFNFNDDVELFAALNQYRISVGFTWKRMCLIGVANTISKNGDSPDLVIALANYLEKKR